MSRFIVFGFVLLSLGFAQISQAQENDVTQAEDHQLLVETYIEVVLNGGDIAAAGDYVAEDYVSNAPGNPPGLEALQFGIQMIRTAFPDIAYSITHIGAEADLVAARLVITGTQQGEFMGLPPAGRKVAAATVNFWRIEDGLIVEQWEVTDSLVFFQQLGIVPGGEEASQALIETLTQAEVEATSTEEISEISELETNHDTVEYLFSEVFNMQRLFLADDVIAQDFVWHNVFVQPGLEGFKAFYEIIYEAFPDVQREPVLVVADADLVFLYNTITGTHLGGEAFYGIPPTGNSINYTSGDIFRVDDGVIVEQWDVADYVTLFTQIGLIPEPR